jgi:hypothetical protein
MQRSTHAPEAESLNAAQTDTVATGGRPEVIVEILFERGLLYVAVRNIGDRPALGTSVRFNEKLVGLGGRKDIASLAMFRNLEFLGPGRELVTLLDSGSSWFAREQPTKLVLEVSYADAEGKRFTDTIRHDLEIFRDLAFIDGPAGTSGDCDISSRDSTRDSTQEVR